MAICPECNGEIDMLDFTDKAERFGHLVIEDGDPQWVEDGTDSPPGECEKYTCPKCRSTIFFDGDDAAKFLEGKLTFNEEKRIVINNAELP